MKKFLSVILALALIFSMSGCKQEKLVLPEIADSGNNEQIEVVLINPISEKSSFDVLYVGLANVNGGYATVNENAWTYPAEKEYVEKLQLSNFEKSEISSEKGRLVAIVARKAFGYHEKEFEDLAFLFKDEKSDKMFFKLNGKEVLYSQYFEKLMEEKIEWDKEPHSSN